MSKTFREYYDGEGFGKIRNNKRSNKQKRQKVKDYLKNIEFDELDEDEELDFDELK